MIDSKDKDISEQPIPPERTRTSSDSIPSPSHPSPPTLPPPVSPESKAASAAQLLADGETLGDTSGLVQPVRPPPPPPQLQMPQPPPSPPPSQDSEEKPDPIAERLVESETPQPSPTLGPTHCPLPASPPQGSIPTINTPIDEKVDEKGLTEPTVSVQPLSLSPVLPAHDVISLVKPAYDDKDSSHGTLSVRSASSLRAPSPLRYTMTPFAMTPGRPVSLMPPPDGRPRDDVPYDSPTTFSEPLDYPTLSGQGRRTTMYFNASRTSLDSVESHDSRHVKAVVPQQTGFWQGLKSCFGC